MQIKLSPSFLKQTLIYLSYFQCTFTMGRGYIVEALVEQYLVNLQTADVSCISGILIGQVQFVLFSCACKYLMKRCGYVIKDWRCISHCPNILTCSCECDVSGVKWCTMGLPAKCSSQRDYILLAAQTPQKEGWAVRGCSLSDLDADWVTEHGRQVSGTGSLNDSASSSHTTLQIFFSSAQTTFHDIVNICKNT